MRNRRTCSISKIRLTGPTRLRAFYRDPRWSVHTEFGFGREITKQSVSQGEVTTNPITVYDSKGKTTTVNDGPRLGCFFAETAMTEEEFKRTSTSEIYTRAHVIAKEKADGKEPLLGLPREPLCLSTEEELRDFWRQDFKYFKAILQGTPGPKFARTLSLKDDIEVKIKAGAPWGFAVYRTAYDPGTEEPWRRILDDIQKRRGKRPVTRILQRARDHCATL